jgi:hypothetical protein
LDPATLKRKADEPAQAHLARHAHRATRAHVAVPDREDLTGSVPHRPAPATSCTLQVPSNFAESARAEPDRVTPTIRPSAATARFKLFVKVDIVTSSVSSPHRLKQSGPANRKRERFASVPRPDQVLPREGASGSVERHW